MVKSEISAAESTEIGSEADVERDVALLKEAANTRAVPTAAVCQALIRLEKKKLAVSQRKRECNSRRRNVLWGSLRYFYREVVHFKSYM